MHDAPVVDADSPSPMRAEWRVYRPSLSPARRFWRGLRQNGWLILLLLILVTSGSCLMLQSAIFAITLFAIAGLILVYAGSSGLRVADEDLLPFLDLPSLPNTYLVDMIVEKRGVAIGRDAGTVCFVDGWMVFSGLQTSFNVSARQCKAAPRSADRSVDDPQKWQGLIVDVPGELASVFYRARETHAKDALGDAIREFLGGSKPEGLGILPPLMLAPGTLRRAQIEVLSSLAFAVLLAALLNAPDVFNGHFDVVPYLVTLCAYVAPAVVKGATSLLRYRKLSILAKEAA